MAIRVLLIGAAGASVYQATSRRVTTRIGLGSGAAALDALCRQLGRDPTQPLCVLLDLVEEEFRSERLPALGASDRDAWLARRLATQFDDTPRRLALCHPPRRGDAADRTVLYAGLTRPAMLEPWLDALKDAGVPLLGIHSLPIVSAGLLPALGLRRGPGLLLSRQACGGLRQSFFRDGHLLLSRLVPLPAGSGNREEDAVTAELIRMRRYLARLDLMPEDADLPTVLLTEPESAPAPGEVPDSLKIMGLDMVARRLKLPATLVGTGVEALILGLLLRRAPVAQYAVSEELKPYRRLQRRRHLLVGASLGLMSGALASAGLTVAGLDLARQATTLSTALRGEQQRLLEATAVLPPAMMPPARLVPVLELAAALEALRGPSANWVAALEERLGLSPGLHWTSLNWQVSDTTGTTVELRGKSALSGHDEMTAQSAVEAFATRLHQLPGAGAVEVSEPPLDLRPAVALSGSAQSPAPREAPSFAVRLRLPMEPDPHAH